MTHSQNAQPIGDLFKAVVTATRTSAGQVVKIKGLNNSIRHLVFNKGLWVDFASNSMEDLPGSYFLKKGLLDTAGFEKYVSIYREKKGSPWLPLRGLVSASESQFTEYRKLHALFLLNEFKLNEITEVTLQQAKVSVTQAMIENFHLFYQLSKKISLELIQSVRRSYVQMDSVVSVIGEPTPTSFDEDQQGLFTVIQHSATLGDVFDSSFLDKNKIVQTLFALDCCGIVRVESESESAKRQYFELLSPEQKSRRNELKTKAQALANASYYEVLGLDRDVDQDDILKAYKALMTHYQSPAYQNLFFRTEENLLDVVLEKTKRAYEVLSNQEKKREYDQFLGQGSAGNFLSQSQTIQEEKALQVAQDLIKQSKLTQAIEFLVDEIRKSPGFLKLHSKLIGLLIQFKVGSDDQLNQKVFELLKEGITKNPAQYLPFQLLGEWCLFLKQDANAQKAFQKALHLNPGSAHLRKLVLEADPKSGKRLVLEAVYQNLGQMNLFDILGVSTDADEKDIRDAYHMASRHFHPDFFFNSDETMKEVSKKVFKEVVASHMVLRDEAKRKAYLESLFSSQKKKDEKQKSVAPKAVQAKKYYEQALQSLKEQNFSSATLNLKLALSYEPDNFLMQKMLKDLQTRS